MYSRRHLGERRQPNSDLSTLLDTVIILAPSTSPFHSQRGMNFQLLENVELRYNRRLGPLIRSQLAHHWIGHHANCKPASKEIDLTLSTIAAGDRRITSEGSNRDHCRLPTKPRCLLTFFPYEKEKSVEWRQTRFTTAKQILNKAIISSSWGPPAAEQERLHDISRPPTCSLLHPSAPSQIKYLSASHHYQFRVFPVGLKFASHIFLPNVWPRWQLLSEDWATKCSFTWTIDS